jgi:hypothetical protein
MPKKPTTKNQKASLKSKSALKTKKVENIDLLNIVEERPDLLELSISLVSPLGQLEKRFESRLRNPKISLVIVNRNGAELLRHSLFALQTQTYPLDEIILVDNGSTDGSVAYIRSEYPLIKIMESGEDLGYTMAVNLASKCAQGDLVAVLGNNMIPTPDWLSHLVAEFQNLWPEVGIVSSLKLSSQKLDEYKSFYREVNFLGSAIECNSGNEKNSFSPTGSAFLYPRHLNLEGPFDPDYQMGEENTYFGWRTRLFGKQVVVGTDAKVFQKDSSGYNFIPLWKRAYFENRNRWMNLLIFYDRSHLILIFPCVVMNFLIKFLKGLTTSLSGLLGVLSAAAWIFFHLFQIYAKRKSIQEKRKVSDDAITRLMTGKIIYDRATLAPFLNGLSLAYCGWVGLKVKENYGE